MSQLSSSVSLPRLAYKGTPVVTTESLAQAYGVEEHQVRQNFKNNRERFIEGKHFYSLSGNDLKGFRLSVENFYAQISPKTRNLTLWTERGAARHAKMLNSDKAWDMFELLEETFFRVARTEAATAPQSPDGPLTPALRAELKALVDAKLSTAPADVQGRARAEVWARFNRHFRIAEYAQLPAGRMTEAREYLIGLNLKALPAMGTPAAPALPAMPASADHELECHCAAMRGLVRQLDTHITDIFTITRNARAGKALLRDHGVRRQLAISSIYILEDAAGAVDRTLAVFERAAKTALAAARL